MYLQFYGLSEPPFSITPDPRFVFLGRQHEDALAHLRYGIAQGGGGGFVQLTGEVGTGKTTLSRLLLEDLPAEAEAALVLNPLLGPEELLQTICEEFGIDVAGAEGSAKGLTDRLNAHLLEVHASGRTAVLLIDEAQNLSPAALEQVRLLTNLETHSQKLLQIILLGQPELRQLLARGDLRQLAQRITARFHLRPLDAAETAAYVGHRLQVAGASANPFTTPALNTLHELTGGVPRLVNIVADRALLAGYAAGEAVIGRGLVRRAWAEVHGEETPAAHGPARALRWLAAAVVAVAVAGGAYLLGREVGAGPAPGPAAGGSTPSSSQALQKADVEALPAAGAPRDGAAPDALPQALGGSTRGRALETLLAARGFPRPADWTGECRWVLAPRIFCLEQRGRLAELRALGRPVAAALAGAWGVLRALPDGGFEWRAPGSGVRALDAAEVERAWSGRYLDVWSMPAFLAEVLQEGDRGPAVLWVKAAAARATPPYTGDVDDPYFGPALRSWAAAFQTRAGLRSDGLVGPETLQRLSSLPSAGGALSMSLRDSGG